MSNLPDTQFIGSYEDRGEALLRKAPQQLLNLLDAIAASDYSRSVVVAQTAGEKHLADFNKRFANLTDAVANFRCDDLMRG